MPAADDRDTATLLVARPRLPDPAAQLLADAPADADTLAALASHLPAAVAANPHTPDPVWHATCARAAATAAGRDDYDDLDDDARSLVAAVALTSTTPTRLPHALDAPAPLADAAAAAADHHPEVADHPTGDADTGRGTHLISSYDTLTTLQILERTARARAVTDPHADDAAARRLHAHAAGPAVAVDTDPAAVDADALAAMDAIGLDRAALFRAGDVDVWAALAARVHARLAAAGHAADAWLALAALAATWQSATTRLAATAAALTVSEAPALAAADTVPGTALDPTLSTGAPTTAESVTRPSATAATTARRADDGPPPARCPWCRHPGATPRRDADRHDASCPLRPAGHTASSTLWPVVAMRRRRRTFPY